MVMNKSAKEQTVSRNRFEFNYCASRTDPRIVTIDRGGRGGAGLVAGGHHACRDDVVVALVQANVDVRLRRCQWDATV